MEIGGIGPNDVSGLGNQGAEQKTGFGALGKTDFMKLLITQLRYQNPLQPTDEKEFIAQLAQFSTLEQMENLNAGLSMLMRFQELNQASSMLGKTIEAVDDEGNNFKGIVKEVKVTSQGLSLLVGNKHIGLGNVIKILLEEK